MSDDIIFPDDRDIDKYPPGSRQEIDGTNYLVMNYIPVGKEITLKDGTKIKLMRMLVAECMFKLYITNMARDN